MLIRHFSTDDISGGAAIAAYRLHHALREAGQDSRMFVRHKKSDDPDVAPLPWKQTETQWKRMLNRLPGFPARNDSADYEFSFDRSCDLDLAPVYKSKTDSQSVNCLHWVNRLLDVRSIRAIYDSFQSPLVWIIHDLAPLSGGCHYSFGCSGYMAQCGECPRLASPAKPAKNDLSHKIWRRKQAMLSDLPICFIAPTSWGEHRIRESSLFQNARVERIPLPMNTSIFRPLEKALARKVMDLAPEKKIILFGANDLKDSRKGTEHLIGSLHFLARMIEEDSRVDRNDLLLLIVGSNGRGLVGKLPFEGRATGQIHDELMMALAYQAADVFVCPSLDDSGPMMISESMLCATPVVAFDTGIAPDVIEHEQNGYLVKRGDEQALARGIFHLLTIAHIDEYGRRARQTTEQMHAPASIARRHVELYQDLIAGRR